jgi:hypothetical protein
MFRQWLPDINYSLVMSHFFGFGQFLRGFIWVIQLIPLVLSPYFNHFFLVTDLIVLAPISLPTLLNRPAQSPRSIALFNRPVQSPCSITLLNHPAQQTRSASSKNPLSFFTSA